MIKISWFAVVTLMCLFGARKAVEVQYTSGNRLVLTENQAQEYIHDINLLAGDDEESLDQFINDQILALSSNKTFESLFSDHLKLFKGFNISQGSPVKCPQRPSEPIQATPTSVHKLRPEDVKVVAALGDSITAANGAGATTVLQVLLNYRGISWSIGGDGTLERIVTLPNIIEEYSRKAKGVSKGICFRFQKRRSGFDVASAGDISQDMPGQARLLIDRLKADQQVDYENDWKVVTIFIGGNNLCRYCYKKNKHSTSNYVKGIRDALDILHAEVPRVFVNLVSTVDVTLIRSANVDAVCDILHLLFCPCGAYGVFGRQSVMDRITAEYRQSLYDLVNSGVYDTRDDFTVVIQPFLENVTIPLNDKGNVDLTYLSPDCFHFSAKSHEAAATGLWNNMLEPIGHKRNFWVPGEALECPDLEKPYFFTSKNSIQRGRAAAVAPAAENAERSSSREAVGRRRVDEHRHASIATGLWVGIFVGSMCLTLIIVGVVFMRRRVRDTALQNNYSAMT